MASSCDFRVHIRYEDAVIKSIKCEDALAKLAAKFKLEQEARPHHTEKMAALPWKIGYRKSKSHEFKKLMQYQEPDQHGQEFAHCARCVSCAAILAFHTL